MTSQIMNKSEINIKRRMNSWHGDESIKPTFKIYMVNTQGREVLEIKE